MLCLQFLLRMDTLRVWTGGTDTSLPDFSTPIGGQMTAVTSPSSSDSIFSSVSSLRGSVPSWVPFSTQFESTPQEDGCIPSLSWTQRMIGFVVFLLVGVMFCGFVRSHFLILTLLEKHICWIATSFCLVFAEFKGF